MNAIKMIFELRKSSDLKFSQAIQTLGSGLPYLELYPNPETRISCSWKTTGYVWKTTTLFLDDFNLEFSCLRIRRGGGDGGHNGLASVLEELDSSEVPRLRMGIGPVLEGDGDIDFVLSAFEPEEDVDGLVRRSCEAVQTWIREGVEVAMNRFNRPPSS